MNSQNGFYSLTPSAVDQVLHPLHLDVRGIHTQTIKGGFDLGNYALKMVTAHGKRHIVNAIKEVAVEHVRSKLSEDESLEEALDILIYCPDFPELHGRRFFVGTLAMNEGEHDISPQTQKATNPLILVPLLAGLALLATVDGQELLVHGYAGLPMAEYLQPALKEEYRNRLNKKYEVQFVSTSGREGWKITIHLALEVTPEGMAAVLRQAQKRNELHKYFARAVCDIGMFSTDIAVLDEKFRPIASLCRGHQFGVAAALDGIRQQIKQEYRVAYPRQIIDHILIHKNGMMRLGKQEVDIKPIAEKHFRPIASQIGQSVTEILEAPRGSEIAELYFLGGGSNHYAPYLRELQERTYTEMIFQTKPDTDDLLFENAQAFYGLAMSR